MGKAAGFLLILAGVGTAAYVVPAVDVKEIPQRVAPASSLTTASIAPAAQPVTPTPAAVSAPVAATRVVPPIEPAREPVSVAAKTVPPVAVEPAPVKVAKASEPIKVAQGTPPRSDQRLALTKEIQRELRRVGCYAGDIDGEWSGDTRQAMKTFIDRVNATLPIDQPDHILKTLVSGHPGEACGRTCPAGQSAAANGRCMPTQIIAQSPNQQTRRPADKAIAQAPTQAPAQPRLDRTATPRAAAPSRDASAVEPAAKAPAAKPSTEAVVSSWAPTVVTAAPLPPVVAVPQPRPEARPAELPDRMAVGVGADADSPVAAPAPKAGSKILIKRRDGVAAVAPPPAAPVAPIPIEAVAPAADARQRTAAIAPEAPATDGDATAAPAQPRPTSRKQGGQPGVYRVPPPRYASVYVSPPRVYSGYNTYRGRVGFGTSVFKRLERDGR